MSAFRWEVSISVSCTWQCSLSHPRRIHYYLLLSTMLTSCDALHVLPLCCPLCSSFRNGCSSGSNRAREWEWTHATTIKHEIICLVWPCLGRCNGAGREGYIGEGRCRWCFSPSRRGGRERERAPSTLAVRCNNRSLRGPHTLAMGWTVALSVSERHSTFQQSKKLFPRVCAHEQWRWPFVAFEVIWRSCVLYRSCVVSRFLILLLLAGCIFGCIARARYTSLCNCSCCCIVWFVCFFADQFRFGKPTVGGGSLGYIVRCLVLWKQLKPAYTFRKDTQERQWTCKVLLRVCKISSIFTNPYRRPCALPVLAYAVVGGGGRRPFPRSSPTFPYRTGNLPKFSRWSGGKFYF